ncbi:MAG: RDD family protein [Actinobacteria bacterium]|nr:RDD family protein [Actinomycetota bacterium]MCL5444702.1 RDD family protein [Actinomycetota bacterium]
MLERTPPQLGPQPTNASSPWSSFDDLAETTRARPYLPSSLESTRAPSKGSILLGGFGSRATGYILDVVASTIWTLLLVLAAAILPHSVGPLVAVVLVIGFNLWYHVWRLGEDGQTWGMKKLGLLLVDKKTGKYPIGLLRSLLRALVLTAFALVPFAIFLDLLWPLFDPWNQTLHDKAASTLVTRRI